MNFLYSGVKTLDAATFKARIDDAELKLRGEPPVFFFSNHDTSRQATRLGDGAHNDAIARLTAAMTLMLRGTALMYYGEELGMQDLPKAALKDVPLSAKRKVADDRDPERSPMQWSANPKAGFTTGDPWLPVNPDAATRNVAAQQRDPASLYHWYRQLLALRHTHGAVRNGAYVPLESGNAKVLAFARRDRAGRGVLVLLNMSDAPQQAHVTGWSGPAPRNARMLMASDHVAKADPAQPMLAPLASRLWALVRARDLFSPLPDLTATFCPPRRRR
jgi:alpha-glucosidase